MLIRWASKDDMPAWIRLADTVAELFNHPTMSSDPVFHAYMERKINQFEALTAIDRMSGNCLGVIGFSRTNHQISWFAVNPDCRGKSIGTRLLNTALRHLDPSKEVTVTTFRSDNPDGLPARAVYQKAGFSETKTFVDERGHPRCLMCRPPTSEKRGGSFHFKYPDYDRYSQEAFCPCCQNVPAPDFLLDITELPYSFATAERIAQGRLFGKCHVLLKKHYVHFEDIPHDIMSGFMGDVQAVGKALRQVTGAIKINYEMHANSGPHIHCHLFPRYLDDDFPSAPIDYRISEPSPYESEAEFLWFVEQMRVALMKKE